MNDNISNAAGTICTVTDDGQFGVVRLDEKTQGHEFAVINRGSLGAEGLRARLGGKLLLKTRVTIQSMIRGNKTFLITKLT